MGRWLVPRGATCAFFRAAKPVVRKRAGVGVLLSGRASIPIPTATNDHLPHSLGEAGLRPLLGAAALGVVLALAHVEQARWARVFVVLLLLLLVPAPALTTLAED